MTASAAARGYGPGHKLLRLQWVRHINEHGGVKCARCSGWIAPTEPWDLGHDDYDRTKYTGPEHRRCNRATLTHRKRREESGEVDPKPREKSSWNR